MVWATTITRSSSHTKQIVSYGTNSAVCSDAGQQTNQANVEGLTKCDAICLSYIYRKKNWGKKNPKTITWVTHVYPSRLLQPGSVHSSGGVSREETFTRRYAHNASLLFTSNITRAAPPVATTASLLIKNRNLASRFQTALQETGEVAQPQHGEEKHDTRHLVGL